MKKNLPSVPVGGDTKDSPGEQTKKRSDKPNRRQFLGRAGGATAAVLAVGAIGLEPLLGLRESVVEAAEISPTTGLARADDAKNIRKKAAEDEKPIELATFPHPTNGDEELYANRIGNFSKTLNHDPNTGEVVQSDYNAFLAALQAGTFDALEGLPQGGTATMANPLGGLSFNMEGPDSPATAIPSDFTPPPIASRRKAAEAVELYWETCLRDLPVNDYGSNPVVQQACNNLTGFDADYTGPTSGGVVTPQLLFRYPYPGCTVGPIVSQFILWPFTYDGITVVAKMRARLPVINWNPDGTFTFNPAGRDYLTEFQEWLNAQNGTPLGNANAFDPTPRFVRSVRDLGNLAGSDNINSVDFRVNLVLGALGVGVDEGNPYKNSTRQSGFATFGAGHLSSLIGQAHKGERHAWYHKWFVHRHLRPDGFGGLVNNTKTGRATYPLHADLLNSPVMPLILAYNQQVNSFRGKSTAPSYLLPMELTNGSPNHPSSPAGHAITVGSCITAIKAW